jgi:hypothetical protein
MKMGHDRLIVVILDYIIGLSISTKVYRFGESGLEAIAGCKIAPSHSRHIHLEAKCPFPSSLKRRGIAARRQQGCSVLRCLDSKRNSTGDAFELSRRTAMVIARPAEGGCR